MDLRGPIATRLPALRSLSEILVFAEELDDPALRGPELTIALIQLIDTATDDQTLALALQCITFLLPLHGLTGIALMRFGIVEKLNRILSRTANLTVAENCFRVFAFYSHEPMVRVLDAVDVRGFFQFFPLLSRIEQRNCITTLLRLITRQTPPQLLDFFDQILQILATSDDAVCREQAQGLLVAALDVGALNPARLDAVIGLANASADAAVVRACAKVIVRFCGSADAVRTLRTRSLNFAHLLFDIGDTQAAEAALQIIQLLLPPPKLPPFLWHIENTRSPQARAFVREISY
jgi:hypothetical protein